MISAAIFDSSGTNTVAYSTIPVLAGGFTINTQLPAQYYNSMNNVWSVASMEVQNVVTNTLTPGTMANVGSPGGTAGLVATDYTQLLKSVIAVSHLVGENIESEIAQTPVAWTAATFASTATQYRPIVSRQSDVVLTTTNYPDLVPALRAEQLNMNYAGVNYNTWTATSVGASTVTLNVATPNHLALLNLLANEFIANAFMNPGATLQPATPGSLFTYNGSTNRTLTSAGVEYPITGVNTATGVITVTGTPGSTTITMFPYRITASTTSAFLPRLSGFVGVSQYDNDGEVVGGFRRMDRMQGHKHDMNNGSGATAGAVSYGAFAGVNNYQTLTAGVSNVQSPTTDGTSGTPRTGKTTDPRTRGVYVYTWAGRLLP